MLASNVSSEQLVTIISQGNKELMDHLIRIYGPNFYVEEKQENGQVLFLTPLSVATSHLCPERSDMVHYLYKAGADFNYFPLPEEFQQVRQYKHDTTGYALRILSYVSKGKWVAEHYDSIVKVLLTRGVKICNSKKDMDIFRLAMYAGIASPSALEQQLGVGIRREYGRDNTLLLQRENDLGLGEVQYLVQQGSALGNEEDKSLLLYTLDPGVAEYMMDAGYNVNVADKKGITPLMRFASWGNNDLISLAVSKGADKKATDLEGKTALDYGLQSSWSLVSLFGLHDQAVLHGKTKSYTVPDVLASPAETQDQILQEHINTYNNATTKEEILASLVEIKDLLSLFELHPLLMDRYWEMSGKHLSSFPDEIMKLSHSLIVDKDVAKAHLKTSGWAKYAEATVAMQK